MVCSQKRRCQIPRSFLLTRASDKCSFLGKPLEKRFVTIHQDKLFSKDLF